MSWIVWFLAVTHGVLSTPVLDLYGCRYVDLCPTGSECIDDVLFGHCGDVRESRFQFGFKLSPKQVTELSFIINDLLTARKTWTDQSTQSVMNKFLAPIRQFTNPYLRKQNEALAIQLDSEQESLRKREDGMQYQRPEGKTLPQKLQWPPKPLRSFGDDEHIKKTPPPAAAAEELYQSPAFNFKQETENELFPGESSPYKAGIQNDFSAEQMNNAEQLLDYLANFHNDAEEVNDFVDNYLKQEGSDYGYFKDESRNDESVPADLYYILYEYLPPNPDTMGLQYQYPNSNFAAAYDYLYPLYATEKPKPDYASLDFEYFDGFATPTMNSVKGALKRESGSDEGKEVQELENKEYPQEMSHEDDVDFPSSIEHLEDEYREYIDSKYANAEDKVKPMERFTISKASENDYPGVDEESENYKQYNENDADKELDDDTGSDDEDEGSADVLKREQVTLYDENYNEGDGFPVLSAETYSLPAVDPNFCFVQTEQPLTYEQGNNLMIAIMNLTSISLSSYNHISFDGRKVTFFVQPGRNLNATEVARKIMANKDSIKKSTGIQIESTGIGSEENERIMFTSTLAEEKSELALICVALLGCIVGLLSGVLGILALKNSKKKKNKAAKLNAALSGEAVGRDFPAVDYQELCREHKAVSKKTSGAEEVQRNKSGSIVSTGQGAFGANERIGSESSEQSDRASVSSWSDDPTPTNLDITTAHAILDYMERRLNEPGLLDREWEELCVYEPDQVSFAKATCVANVDKNRFPTSLPFDNNRVLLNPEISQGYGDYINASAIRDSHPNASYILAQSPMENTVADFWQMVWDQKCTVAVLIAGRFDSVSHQTVDGLPQFWPAEGNGVYHNFEVHLVSEHVWCGEYLVRSIFLKNMLTTKSRTITLFHYLVWEPRKIPESGSRPLLEFRRKVKKAYTGKLSPIIIMCGNGCDQSACYALIDLVLSKIYRGTREIDISATLEFLRDQRCGAVATKEQYEFCISTVAEDLHCFLKSIEPCNASAAANKSADQGQSQGEEK